MAASTAEKFSGKSGSRSLKRSVLKTARQIVAAEGADALSAERIASELNVAPEAIAGIFRGKNEMLLSLAAEEMSALARAMHKGRTVRVRRDAESLVGVAQSVFAANPQADAPATMPPQEAEARLPRLKRLKPIEAADSGAVRKSAPMTPELEAIFKGITSPESTGLANSISKLERRTDLLEMGLKEEGDRQAKTASEQDNAISYLGESLASMNIRLHAVEARVAELALELANLKNAPAQQPEPPSGPRPTGAAEPILLDVQAGDEPLRANNLDLLLNSARRAAMESTPVQPEEDSSWLHAVHTFLTRPRSRGHWLGTVAMLTFLAIVPAGLLGFVRGSEEAKASAALTGVVAATEAEPVLQDDATQGVNLLKAGDEDSAFPLLQRAAETNDSKAQYWLGSIYAHRKNMPEAARWYAASATGGNVQAMNNLAVAYAQGSGVGQDMGTAAQWFAKAAAQGFADAQFNLAVLYERGDGVAKSLSEAYTWYAVAAAAGDEEARARVTALAKQLDPGDVLKAQEAADRFRPAGQVAR